MNTLLSSKKSHKSKISRRRELVEQFREETSPLLTMETLETRLSQIDRIIQRKASSALFSLDTNNSKDTISRRSNRLERMAEEFLYRVQARRKRARSYCYLIWFLILFFVFLVTQFMKEDNRNLFIVDKSIKSRVVNILPKGALNADSDFYNWLSSTVQDIFKPTMCGNGLCEAPDEYPGIGRFGCVADCGHYFNRTTLRIDLGPVWELAGGPLASLRNKSVFGGGSLPVGFSYNVYSETLMDYIFGSNMVARSVDFDVPDGVLRLDLYQNFLVRPELPAGVIGDLTQVASETLPEHNFQLPDFQYGDAPEVFGTAAALIIQLQDFCQSQAAASYALCVNASSMAMTPEFISRYFLDNYGLSGSVQLLRGAAGVPQVLATIPFCSFTAGSESGSSVFDAARTLPCTGKGSGGMCLNARSLIRSFTCKASYNISIWSWGLPRALSVKPSVGKAVRAVTPFNNIIGGLIISQIRRKASICPVDPPSQIKALVNTFPCQNEVRGQDAFGMDPTFIVGSPQYAGQLSMDMFYAPNELRNQSSTSSRAMSLRRTPFGFFPHQWGKGVEKPDKVVHKKDIGVYKVYWDSRLSATSAQNLLNFIQTAAFVDEFTSSIELEMVTYNPEFAVFGVATFLFSWDLGGNIVWNYQYDTVRLDIYSGALGQQRMAADIIFGIMLGIDILREAKDMYDSIRHDRLLTHYCKSLFKYVNWIHYGFIFAGIITWIEFNRMSTSITLSDSYPILFSLEARARPFMTIPDAEFELLVLVDKLRSLCQVKNKFAALNVVSTLLFIARVLKILDFQPRMALITRTLRQAGVDLIHFLLLFTVFLGGYSVIATLLLGGQLQEFNGPDTAAISLFFLCLGWEPQYAPMLAAIETRQSGFAVLSFQLFYWSFISIASFILLNVVLAIIVEAYAVVKRKNMDVKSMGTDILEITGYAGKRLYNRLCEKDFLVSDRKLEHILLEATQKRGLRVRKKKSKIKGPNALRLPGGLILTAKDLATLLEGSGTKGRSLLRRTSCSVLDKGNLTANSELNEVVDSDVEEDFVISHPIQDVINRYEERVDEVKEEHDFFRLIKAESMKRQMTLFPSMDLLKHQVEDMKVTVGFLASKLLSKDEKSGLRFEKLIVAAQSNQLDRPVQISELLEISDCLFGELKITVVSAKFLFKEFVSSANSDLAKRISYCVIFLEEGSTGSGELEILVRTPISELLDSEDRGWHSGNPDIVWNTSYVISLEAKRGSNIVVAIIDQHDDCEDTVVGTVSIPLAKASVGEESDKWYPLHNITDGGNEGSLVKLKVKFTVQTKSDLEILESLDQHAMKHSSSLRRWSSDEEHMAGLEKIQEKLKPMFSRAPSQEIASCPGAKAQDSSIEHNTNHVPPHPVPSAATIKNRRKRGSREAIYMCAHEGEAVQSQSSTTSTKELDSKQPEAAEAAAQRMPAELLPDTVVDSGGCVLLHADRAAQAPESPGSSTSRASDGVFQAVRTYESLSGGLELETRPSIHLDSSKAFSFRCSVRARLSLADRLAKQFHPSLGGDSFLSENNK